MNTMYDTKFTSHENTNLIWDLLNEHTTEKFSYNLKSNNNKDQILKNVEIIIEEATNKII